MHTPDWTVVVPVKRLADAKSRLRGTVAARTHAALVLAMAQDTVQAVVACQAVRLVVVVTDDPVAADALAALDAHVVADTPGAGLNAAVSHGQQCGQQYGQGGGSGGPAAALAADLPALRAGELAQALHAAGGRRRCFVVDAAGTGTTLLTAPPGMALRPRFGPGSAAAHAASGARRLAGRWPSLHRDVDTAGDLAAAVRLGLGAHTATLLRSSAGVRAGQQA